jgi:hypothetical protein
MAQRPEPIQRAFGGRQSGESRRIERQMRDVALDHVAERIDDSAYLERLGQVRVDLATVDTTARGDLSARRAGQGPFVPLSRSRLRTGCSALLG